jgi:hypothetical protein
LGRLQFIDLAARSLAVFNRFGEILRVFDEKGEDAQLKRTAKKASRDLIHGHVMDRRQLSSGSCQAVMEFRVFLEDIRCRLTELFIRWLQ